MAKEIKLTREGFERLQATLDTEKARLEEATRVLQEQMETSTDAEDTGLEDAKREKMNIEARIDELEDTLTRAQLVEGKGAEGRVSLGTVVILHNEATKKDMKVQVVSSFPDVKVQKVSSFPDSCGKWKMVTSFPDTKVLK